MDIEIATPTLQRMASQVSRAVGNSKILPVTQYVRLRATGTQLELTATNSSVFVTAFAPVGGTPGEAVVRAEPFLKLVGKTVVETMRLTVAHEELRIRGHGRYRQPLYTETPFPEWGPVTLTERGRVDSAVLKTVFGVAEAAVARELIQPQLTGYYWGSHVVTTDNVRCCVATVPVGLEPPVLLAATVADLVSQFLDDEEIVVATGEHQLQLSSPSLCIQGPELFGVETYPRAGSLVDAPVEGSVTVRRDALVEAVERVNLFSDPLRNYGVQLTVGDEVVVAAGETAERVAMEEGMSMPVTTPVTMVVNSEYWLRLLHACAGELLTVGWLSAEGPLVLSAEEGSAALFLGTVAAVSSTTSP